MGHYPSGVMDPIDTWVDGWTATMWPEKQASFVYTLRGHVKPGDDEEIGTPIIYIGLTDKPRQRLRAHVRKWWWPAVDLTQSELDGFRSREEAARRESEWIGDENPPMNTAARSLAAVVPL